MDIAIKNKMIILKVVGILIYSLALAMLLLVNYQPIIAVCLFVAESAGIVFSGMRRLKNKRQSLEFVLFCVTVLCDTAWCITSAYVLYIAVILCAHLLGIYLVIFIRVGLHPCVEVTQKRGTRKISSVVVKVATGIVLSTAMLASAFLLMTAINPVPFCSFIQVIAHATNTFKAQLASTQTVLNDGTLLVNNIQYGNTYPNSFLDIYIAADHIGKINPSYLFIHGGGYVWGDKADGDPNAWDQNGFYRYLRSFLTAGYNVVCVNYALAPEYQYPTPIYQLSEAVEYLQMHDNLNWIDMSNIVFGGSSVGGQIVGQFVAIQTNPEYAKELNIAPVVSRENIKAVVFSSALLDSDRFSKTGTVLTDWLFLQLGRAYFGLDFQCGNDHVVQSNVLTHLSDSFPPTFISDGNYSTFYDQALDFHQRLDELSVKNALNIYKRSEVYLYHGFETDGSKYAIDNMSKLLAFLDAVS